MEMVLESYRRGELHDLVIPDVCPKCKSRQYYRYGYKERHNWICGLCGKVW